VILTRGRRFVAIATIWALAVASSCASKTAQPRAAAPSPFEQLRRDLAAIFSDPAIDHAQWSVAVESLSHGDSLYRLNAQRLQVPASNQKLLTTAVAAERLGWDFRYTNRVYALGAITDGVLDGDLVVTSDGDPTINPRHPRRWGALDDWAKQLADRGLRRISGAIIGDDNAFAEPGWGLGWSWDDIPAGYGAPVGALQYNESQVEVEVLPGVRPGAQAFVDLSPASSGLGVDHDVTTGPDGSETRILVDRMLGSAVVTVRGQVATGDKSRAAVAVANPTQQYVNALRVALELRGIVVDGPALDIDELATPPAMTDATLLIEDRSPPLADIVGVTLKFSRNIYAETLLRSLATDNPRTAEAGLQVLRDTLLSWGIPNEGYLARDGSGLSRYDWISADTIAKLLVHAARDPKLADQFRLTLAVPGENGTLENRMVNTPLQARVWAKTGSMSQVRSMSGYLTTLAGEPLVFSIIVNGFRLPSRDIDAVMDHALARVVEFRR
jgi:D-alanyl-D-alanine carboxypeptidase/D-alanyl-D-alanine-endopeptidase (penicillin-binding protein 4)